jgi:hypothetical protein
MTTEFVANNLVADNLVADNLVDEEQDITDYLVYSSSELSYCDFCCKFGHSSLDCTFYISVGNALHLKGFEVKEFDIEMNCYGSSIRAWINSLTFRQVKLLARRINLPDYAFYLDEHGLNAENHSLLITRNDYNVCIYMYYYYQADYYAKKKINICVNLKEDGNLKEDFTCPICIENIPSNEIYIFYNVYLKEYNFEEIIINLFKEKRFLRTRFNSETFHYRRYYRL